MMDETKKGYEKSPRIQKLIDALYEKMPEIESKRAVLITESYQETEGEPIISRRSKAFKHIAKNLPVVIRENELIVGSATIAERGCQTFPEFSFDWLIAELDTVATRSADPFYISEEAKNELRKVHSYWKGKTTSELADYYMAPETKLAMEHNVFTPGNYFYNGVGHITVQYDKVIAIGYEGIKEEVLSRKKDLQLGDADYARRLDFYHAVIRSCDAAILYAKRYAAEAKRLALTCQDEKRRQELLIIANNCERVPAKGATTFYEACQAFWFVQLLLQIESSGHSISPGRFDQYLYPYYKADREAGRITGEQAQEIIDCIFVKLNDINKCRDAASAEGFAGYGMFQNMIVGGQDSNGRDATNELSFMVLEAVIHTMLPQPSLSIRVWNGSPHDLLIKAAEVTRTGIGLPAYYNDEVIIPAMMSKGATIEEARNYNIIGCVEPQVPGKTDGWHDAAFFNMCRPLEMVFSGGYEDGKLVGVATGSVENFTTFEAFYDAYKKQMEYFISLLVNADNAIDMAHAKLCPLPFESSMVEDCIGRGLCVQEGGAKYNFTGPQGFGIANMTDSLYAIKKLVYEEGKVGITEVKEALLHNFGIPTNNASMNTNSNPSSDTELAEQITVEIVRNLRERGVKPSEKEIEQILKTVLETKNKNSGNPSPTSMSGSSYNQVRYQEILEMIEELPKYGNDISEIDEFAREIAYTYTKPLQKYKNPRGGVFQAGLYPVSANVPLGQQTGATPDGRIAHTPIADGVGPAPGRDVKGPTAAANSVARLDHMDATNGTLYNQKFHPSALQGRGGLEKFVALIRAFFDQKGMHVQFNVVSRETLLDAQRHPENYKHLVVRVAGYSALFTTLSRSLQDDIINRTTQGF